MTTDLLYVHVSEVKAEIMTAFPQATFEPEYNEFKGHRVLVEIPSISEEDWFRFAINAGYGTISLAIQLGIYDKEKKSLIKKILAEGKQAEPVKLTKQGIRDLNDW